MMRRLTPAQLQKAVDAFNARFSIGDEVIYFEVIGMGEGQRLRTRTEAQILSGHSPVVWLEGRSGCVHVSHCFPPPLELVRGRTYRAKKPAPAGDVTSFFNDRQILYIDDEVVQYDSPAVSLGRHYPTVSREKFLTWAGQDVTGKLPEGKWQRWAS